MFILVTWILGAIRRCAEGKILRNSPMCGDDCICSMEFVHLAYFHFGRYREVCEREDIVSPKRAC